MIDEKLNFLEVDEAPFFIFGDGAKKLQDFGCGGAADTAAFAGVGMAESDFVTLAEGGKGVDGFGVLALFSRYPRWLKELIRAVWRALSCWEGERQSRKGSR